MDAVRALAMLLGIVLHASIAYKLTPRTTWPSDDVVHSVFFNYLYSFIHSFRMQLFFLVAGFFARFLYLKIGRKAFVKHRIQRIVIPFLGGLIIIVPLTMLPFIYYHYWSTHPGQTFMQAMPTIAHGLLQWNGMAHLWFLYYLSVFYILMIIALLVNNEIRLGTNLVNWIYNKILVFPRNYTLLLLIVPLFLVSCLIEDLPIRSYTGFWPDIPLWSYYAFFFTLGYIIHKFYVTRLDVFKKNAFLYSFIGLAIVPFIDQLYQIQHTDNSIQTFILIRLLFSIQTVALVFGLLGLAIRFLSSENHTLRYISDASYWMYLIHLPLIAATQFWLIDSQIPPIFRFGIVNLVGIGIPLLTYALFVRYTAIGRMLNGPRQRRYKNGRTWAKEVIMRFSVSKKRLPLQKNI